MRRTPFGETLPGGPMCCLGALLPQSGVLDAAGLHCAVRRHRRTRRGSELGRIGAMCWCRQAAGQVQAESACHAYGGSRQQSCVPDPDPGHETFLPLTRAAEVTATGLRGNRGSRRQRLCAARGRRYCDIPAATRPADGRRLSAFANVPGELLLQRLTTRERAGKSSGHGLIHTVAWITQYGGMPSHLSTQSSGWRTESREIDERHRGGGQPGSSSSISVTNAAMGERSERVSVTCANRGWPFSFSTTATTPSCRPTRRLSRCATSCVRTTREPSPMRERTVSRTLRSNDCASSTMTNA